MELQVTFWSPRKAFATASSLKLGRRKPSCWTYTIMSHESLPGIVTLLHCRLPVCADMVKASSMRVGDHFMRDIIPRKARSTPNSFPLHSR